MEAKPTGALDMPICPERVETCLPVTPIPELQSRCGSTPRFGKEQEALSIADCEIDWGENWPRVPDGTYDAILLYHETACLGRTPKVYLRFRITSPGEYIGKEIYRAFGCKRLLGKPGRNGRFRVGRHHLLFKTMCRVLELQVRADRVSLQPLKGRVLRVTTRTVTQDYRQAPHPELCWYSVVDEILGVVA